MISGLIMGLWCGFVCWINFFYCFYFCDVDDFYVFCGCGKDVLVGRLVIIDMVSNLLYVISVCVGG